MSDREYGDELERMRARARRDGSRQRSADAAPPPGSSRQTRTPGARRPAHEEYDEEYFYGEDYDRGDRYRYEEDGYGGMNNHSYEEDGYGGMNNHSYDEDDYEDTLTRDRHQPSSPRRRETKRPQSSAPRQGRASGASAGRGGRAANTKQTAAAARSQSGSEKRAAGNRGKGRDAAERQQGQMTKRRKKGRWKGLLLILLAIFIGYGAWLFFHRPTGYWNIAVFGVDSRDGNTKNALADVQMICSIDRSTGEIRLVSVYRDTYLKINSEGTYHKINEAYFKGGHKQAVSALEENLDIRIDDYAAFNWKAVAEAINILGGVDLEITPAEFGMINGFITETVNSTGIGSVQLTQAGMNHLDGVQAVAYSRLRLMDTDFQRTERQRKVVMLALEKAKQADVSTLSSLAAYLIPEISTSVGVNDVLPLVKDIGKYHIGETGGFPFSRQTMRIGKMDCVVPTTLESNVVLLHRFLYGEDTPYSPSSAVKKISAHISEETGLYEEGKAAPSGGSSGGSTGGSPGKDSSSGGQAPAGAPEAGTPPETTAALEPTEESTEETNESTEETTAGETEETEEIGPGVSDTPTKAPEATKGRDDESGPGVDGPAASGGARPSAPQPSEISSFAAPADPDRGPGSDGSQNPGSSGSGGSQNPGSLENGGGQNPSSEGPGGAGSDTP